MTHITGASIGQSAARDRPAGIADPLAPGAGVKPGARESRVLEREQVVTGGHARAAHHDHVGGRCPAKAIAPAPLELLRRQKATVGPQIGAEGMVHGSGDAAGDRIDRLDRSREALRARASMSSVRWLSSAAISSSVPITARRSTCPGPVPIAPAVPMAPARGADCPAARGEGSPDSKAPRASSQALMPPSSTATLGCLSQRSSHHARAANEPFDSS
jgi:hypothetical protein